MVCLDNNRISHSESTPLFIDSELCVRTSRAYSSCSACADVCPENAIQISATTVSLDESLCTQCNLCTAACNEEAVVSTVLPASYISDEVNFAYFACRESGLVSKANSATPSCIASLSISMLLKLYLEGISEFLVCLGACNGCKYNIDSNLFSRIDQLNNFLKALDLPEIRFEIVDESHYRSITSKIQNLADSRKSDRRLFFRRAIQEVATISNRTSSQTDIKHSAKLIGRIGSVARVAGETQHGIFDIQIDPQKCTACLDCMRVCPHDAMECITENSGSRLHIRSQNCTGCHACEDICVSKAIQVSTESAGKSFSMDLRCTRCEACGVDFQEILSNNSKSTVCPICTVKAQIQTQNQKLFQVY